MGFSRQEYWSGLPFPPPGDLPDLGIKPASPALGGGFFTPVPPGKQFYLTFTSHLIEMPAYDWNVDPIRCQAPRVCCLPLHWGVFSYLSCLMSDVINKRRSRSFGDLSEKLLSLLIMFAFTLLPGIVFHGRCLYVWRVNLALGISGGILRRTCVFRWRLVRAVLGDGFVSLV